MESTIETRFRAIVEFMEEGIPFNAFLGVKVAAISDGRCVLHLPWREDFVGDPYRHVLHGGVTSTLMDTAGGAAAFTGINLPDDRLSTVDIRIDYLRPGPAGDLYCEAVAERIGKHVASTRMSLWEFKPEPSEQRHEHPIATGRGVYSIKRGVEVGIELR